MARLFFLSLGILIFSLSHEHLLAESSATNSPSASETKTTKKDDLQGSVTLEWDSAPDASVVGYRIYYGTASGNYSQSVKVPASAGASKHRATVSGLVENTTYYMAATSYDANGVESVFSNEITYTVPKLQN